MQLSHFYSVTEWLTSPSNQKPACLEQRAPGLIQSEITVLKPPSRPLVQNPVLQNPESHICQVLLPAVSNPGADSGAAHVPAACTLICIQQCCCAAACWVAAIAASDIAAATAAAPAAVASAPAVCLAGSMFAPVSHQATPIGVPFLQINKTQQTRQHDLRCSSGQIGRAHDDPEC